jgi:hypothetical protein
MAAARRFSLLLVALAAATALAVVLTGLATGPAASRAAIRDLPTFLFATIADGKLRGSVAAVQRTSTPRANVFVSLHGLTPSKAYTGTITDVPCGRAASRSHTVLDLLGVKRTGEGEDDFFEKKSGRLSKRLARGVTVRISEGGTEIACARANRVR